MSLSTLKLANTVKNAAVIMGTTQIEVKGKVEDVIAISPLGENQVPSAQDARFYLSPLVAKTAFDDLGSGVDVSPAFSGRTFDEMQAHLLKNQK